MTISELENMVKTIGFVGYESQLGYVVFPDHYINERSEWLVNVIGDILVVRNVRYNKKLNKILQIIKFQQIKLTRKYLNWNWAN